MPEHNTHNDKLLSVGDKLKNGAILILRRSHEVEGSVILANWDGKWVTWRIDQFGDCHWGHYFGNQLCDFNDAVKDF